MHYRTNVAALYFNLKEYDRAWEIYIELLQKSAIFEISREEFRILNDMANIEWIKGNIKAAEIKYYRAVEIAKNAGYYHNYWPILINLISLLVYQHDYENALGLHYELMPYIKSFCEKFSKKLLAPETSEYYKAAVIICIHNLWSISKGMDAEVVLKYILQICDISKIYKCKSSADINEMIKNLTLQNTIYEHKMTTGEYVYLLKD